MISGYMQAGNYRHRFYLPHLKIAKSAHEASEFDVACHEYCKAVDLIREMPPDEVRAKRLASALTNLASCLTSMHRYSDAMAAMEEAKHTMHLPSMEVTETILLAAMDREEDMEACLIALAEADSPVYDQTLDTVEGIMYGYDPHFCVIPADESAFPAFWQWFAEHEEELSRLSLEAPNKLSELLCSRLAPCFPFEHHALRVDTAPSTGARELRFIDFYSRSLHAGYEALIDSCPPELAARWELMIE